MSQALGEVLNEAAKAAKGLGDEFVSTEHLLLALARKGDGQELRRHLKDSLATLLASEDHQESVAAFLERRPPSYRGR